MEMQTILQGICSAPNAIYEVGRIMRPNAPFISLHTMWYI